MPPPKPSSEARSDPRAHHEITQLVRALRAHGPLLPQPLAEIVGAAFWDPEHFDRAVTLGVAEGLLVRDREGRLAAP